MQLKQKRRLILTPINGQSLQSLMRLKSPDARAEQRKHMQLRLRGSETIILILYGVPHTQIQLFQMGGGRMTPAVSSGYRATMINQYCTCISTGQLEEGSSRPDRRQWLVSSCILCVIFAGLIFFATTELVSLARAKQLSLLRKLLQFQKTI